MDNTTVVSSPTSELPAVAPPADSRCPFRYPNGRRCRLPGSASQSGFCLQHFRLTIPLPQAPSDFEDLSADLLPQLSEFDAAVSINQFLSRLLVLVTKGRVTPRRATVMAYITNQILHSHRAIERELQVEEEGPAELDFTGWPRNDRRHPETIRVDLGDLHRPDRSQPCTGVTHPTTLPRQVSPNPGNGAPK
jgi:hypothetical protein